MAHIVREEVGRCISKRNKYNEVDDRARSWLLNCLRVSGLCDCHLCEHQHIIQLLFAVVFHLLHGMAYTSQPCNELTCKKYKIVFGTQEYL